MISKHRLEKSHEFHWDNIEILHRENSYYKLFLEE